MAQSWLLSLISLIVFDCIDCLSIAVRTPPPYVADQAAARLYHFMILLWSVYSFRHFRTSQPLKTEDWTPYLTLNGLVKIPARKGLGPEHCYWRYAQPAVFTTWPNLGKMVEISLALNPNPALTLSLTLTPNLTLTHPQPWPVSFSDFSREFYRREELYVDCEPFCRTCF